MILIHLTRTQLLWVVWALEVWVVHNVQNYKKVYTVYKFQLRCQLRKIPSTGMALLLAVQVSCPIWLGRVHLADFLHRPWLQTSCFHRSWAVPGAKAYVWWLQDGEVLLKHVTPVLWTCAMCQFAVDGWCLHKPGYSLIQVHNRRVQNSERLQPPGYAFESVLINFTSKKGV